MGARVTPDDVVLSALAGALSAALASLLLSPLSWPGFLLASAVATAAHLLHRWVSSTERGD